MPLRPNVSQLQYHLAPELLLKIQVVILHIRRLDVSIEGENVALDHAAWSSVERLAGEVRTCDRIDGRRIQVRHLDGVGPNVVIGGAGSKESRVGQVAQRHVLRESVKEEAIAGTHHGPALPGYIPHHAGAWGEVLLI